MQAKKTLIGDNIHHLRRYVYRYKVGLRNGKLNMIKKYIEDIKNLHVLDVGCGCGVFSSICYEKGANVCSIDVSDVMVRHVHKTNRALFSVQSRAENLPFKDDLFDLVLVLDVIEHVHRPLQLLKEIYRVMKENTILLLTTDNIKFFITQRLFWYYSGLVQRLKKDVPREPKERLPSTHVKTYSTDQIITLLKKAEFSVLKYDTLLHRQGASAPFFEFVKLPIDLALRGGLRKYKWNSVFLLCKKGSSE